MRIRVHVLPNRQPADRPPSQTERVRPLIVRLYAGMVAAGIIWFMPKVVGWQGMQLILAISGALGLAWAIRRIV